MKKVLCFGDSNTFGFNPKDGSRFDKTSRWTGILQSLCGEKIHVIEAGCNNRTAFSDNPAGKMFTGHKILPEILQPNIDVVILAMGVNDLQFQYKTTLEDVIAGMSKLVEIVKKGLPKAKIILVSPTNLTENVLKSPIFSTLFDKTSIEKSKHFSKVYSEISKKYACEFIDLNDVATPSDIDGLHFEPKEHEKIAKEIFEHL